LGQHSCLMRADARAQEELLKVRRASQEQWDFLDRQRQTEVAALHDERARLGQQLEELKAQLTSVRCSSPSPLSCRRRVSDCILALFVSCY
jgi:hypothetical protein